LGGIRTPCAAFLNELGFISEKPLNCTHFRYN
jgi:hypothetical protein